MQRQKRGGGGGGGGGEGKKIWCRNSQKIFYLGFFFFLELGENFI